MKKKSRPVSVWDTSARAGNLMPDVAMENLIKTAFPTKIQEFLNSLDEEEQNDIKALFNHYVTEIEECGEKVFTE